MKLKYSCYLIILFSIMILLKYFISDYQIKYKIDSYNVIETYENNKYTFELKEENYFIISFIENKTLSKKLIKKIDKKESNEYICYNVVFINDKNYLTCFKEKESISYYLIEDEEIKNYINKLDLEIYKEEIENSDFKFYNNLDKEEYIALWNYKGFYIMNGEEISEVELFNTTKYDNSLCYQMNHYLILPNYDKIHEFKEFKILNLMNEDIKTIKTKYTIDFDSYIVGTYKNKVYLYDNKYSNLYEINYKKENIELVGSEKLGYFKYENNKKKNSSVKEYKNKVKYQSEEKYSYEISDALYKVYNKNYKVKIFNSNELKIIKEFKNTLYFIYQDNLYKYSDNKIVKIFHNFEMNFNSENIIFIYNN